MSNEEGMPVQQCNDHYSHAPNGHRAKLTFEGPWFWCPGKTDGPKTPRTMARELHQGGGGS